MSIQDIMTGIRSLEPQQFEQLLVLIKEYDAQVRASRAAGRPLDMKETERLAAKVFSENDGALARLAEMERREREAQSNLE